MRLKEQEMLTMFRRDAGNYKPLMVVRVEEQVRPFDGFTPDAVIEFAVEGGPSLTGVTEIKPVATPKAIEAAAAQLAAAAEKTAITNIVPLVLVPYMGTKQSRLLADKGISWIDLCGNMVIRFSNRVYIERTGKRNRFPNTAPIKKIFQGVSSLVSRALLLKAGGFGSVYQIVDFINKRNASITMPTVSKVLKALEEELLVKKDTNGICVTNAKGLLDGLAQGYATYTKGKQLKKYKFAIDNMGRLGFALYESQVDYAACGFYAAKLKGLATTEEMTIFIRNIDAFQKALLREYGQIPSDFEFGNLTAIETNDPCVWFNIVLEPRRAIVDDIELYLEMTVDTPRGPKIAEYLKQRILKGGYNG